MRERAQRILAEAQRLRDRLDQTDGLLSFTLQAQTGITEFTPLAASATARMHSSLFAA